MRKSNIVPSRTICIGLMALLGITGVCPAPSMVTDGYAALRLVCLTERLVLCETQSSDGIGLFALDVETGKVLWRKQGLDTIYNEEVEMAVYEGDKAIGITSYEELVCRSLVTGDVLWRTDVFGIAPPPAARSREYDPVKHVPGPNFFGPFTAYSGPFITDKGVIVFRKFEDRLELGSPLAAPLYLDWISFSAETGRLLRQGAGLCLGQAGNQLLVNASHPDLGRKEWDPPRLGGQIVVLSDISTGAQSPIGDELPYKSRWRMPGSEFDYATSYSDGNCCLIETPMADIMRIFDGNTGQLLEFSLGSGERGYQHWAVLADHIISHSVITRAPESLQVTVRDLNGRRLRRRTFPVTGMKSFFSFVGTNTAGNVVLLARGKEGERLLTFEVPSLELLGDVKLEETGWHEDPVDVTWHNMRPNWASDRNRSWGRLPQSSADVFYEIIGNGIFQLSKEESGGISHPLVIRATDPLTGQKRWEHIERVTVKRMEREQGQEEGEQ